MGTWEAEWHAEGVEATPMRFDRVVPECDARRITGASGKPLKINARRYRLENRTLMTVREITPQSASILDRVLDLPAEDGSEILATGNLGRTLTAAERKALEERAMTVAAKELRAAGWTTIERTAESKSWDFEVKRRPNG